MAAKAARATETKAYKFRRLADGKVVTVRMTFAELLERQDILGCITLDDGSEAKRIADHAPKTHKRPKGLPWSRPLESYSLAVHPDQVPEFRERARRHGITGIDWDQRTGKARIDDRGSRRKWLKAIGLNDRDGGYGDG